MKKFLFCAIAGTLALFYGWYILSFVCAYFAQMFWEVHGWDKEDKIRESKAKLRILPD